MLYRRHVHSVSKSGSALITGDVTFSEGSNVTLTQIGSNIEIAATGGGGGGAPTNSQYVTLATDATLTNERVLTGTANQVVITDNGAGSTVVLSLPQSIHTGASPTFTGLTLSGLTVGSVVFAGAGGVLSQDNARFYWDNTAKCLAIGDKDVDLNLGGVTFGYNLTLNQDGGTNPVQFGIHRHGNTSTIGAGFTFTRSRGTNASPSTCLSGDVLGFMAATGYTGATTDQYDLSSYLLFSAAANHSSTSTSGKIEAYVSPTGSTTPARALLIDQNKQITMDAYGTGVAHFSGAGLISSSTIVNADVSASAAIDITKIANGTANQLIKANAGATANEFATLSGGTGLSVTFGAGTIALANTGVTSIVAGTAISVSGATGAVTVNNTGVTSAIGTANQVNVSGATGAVTFSLPQNIHTAATPTFAGLTITPFSVAGVVHNNASGVLSSSLVVNADVSASAAIAYSKLNLATSIVNADVSASAAIAYSKLNLATSIVNADISASAAIAYSKLNLANSIVNADISTSAAIARSKLATGTINHVVINDGSGNFSSEANLAVSRGGTGAGTLTANNVILGNGTSAVQFVAPGSSGNVLTSNGTTWTSAAASAGTITIGTSAIASGTVGRVLFQGAGNVFQQDAQLFFDTSMDELLVPKIGGGTATSDSLTLEANQNAFAQTNTGRISIMERMIFSESFTPSTTLNDAVFTVGGTITSAQIINIFSGFRYAPEFKVSVAQVLSGAPAFVASPRFTHTVANLTDVLTYYQGYDAAPQFDSTAASGTSTSGNLYGYNARPQVIKTGAAAITVPLICGLITYGSPLIGVTDWAAVTVTEFNGVRIYESVGSSATCTNWVGIKYVSPSTVNKPTITNEYAFQSDMTAGATKWNIYCSADAQSSHEGLFKFGDNVAPTALVHTTGSTTARSSVRIEAGTAPTTPNEGDVWHDSTNKNLKEYTAGVTQAISTGLFSQTASKTLASSTTETTLFTTGQGTVTLPANFFVVGKTIKVRLWGYYSTKAAPVGSVSVRVKYGSTTLQTNTFTPTASMTNMAFYKEAIITCRTTGATGTVFTQGIAQLNQNTATLFSAYPSTTATVTIDTTASNAIDVTWQWATSNASNTVTVSNAIVEVVY